MNWLFASSIAYLSLAVTLLSIEPKATQKGLGRMVVYAYAVLFFFGTGFLVTWLIRE